MTRSGTLYYPIWLSYATGLLEAGDFEVDLVDAPAEGMDVPEILERIRSGGFHLVVLESSTPSIESDAALADEIASMGPYVVLVGTHPSALPVETLALGSRFHAVAVGEYDFTLLGLAGAIRDGTPVVDVPGLLLRTGGDPISTGRREPAEDLDSIPFVSRVYKRHLDPARYSNPNALHPMVMIMGGRGCPNSCTFCLFPQTLTGRRARFRSTADIVAEFLWVEENMPGIRSVFFEDDTISSDTGRLRDLAAGLIAAGTRLRWTANMRACTDYETLRICREAGLRTVCTGFESGVPEILAALHKGVSVDEMRAFAADARRAGVLVHGCFLFGAPGETRETMERTLRFALSMDLYTAQFYPLMVYPGTDAWREAGGAGRITESRWRDWLTAEGLHRCVIRTDELGPEELSAFCDEARRRFYLRPGYILRTALRALGDRDEFRRTLKAFGTFRRHLFRRGRRPG